MYVKSVQLSERKFDKKGPLETNDINQTSVSNKFKQKN